MKISARNQFVGNIARMQTGPVTAELGLRLRVGPEISATLTSASATAMGRARATRRWRSSRPRPSCG